MNRPPTQTETPARAGAGVEGQSTREHNTPKSSAVLAIRPARRLCRACGAPRPGHDSELCEQCCTWDAIGHTVEHLGRLIRRVQR